MKRPRRLWARGRPPHSRSWPRRRTEPLRENDLTEFVDAYRAGARHQRVESDRFRRFSYDELIARDKVNLDITWLKDDSLEDPDSLPEPAVLIAEIYEE